MYQLVCSTYYYVESADVTECIHSQSLDMCTHCAAFESFHLALGLLID